MAKVDLKTLKKATLAEGESQEGMATITDVEVFQGMNKKSEKDFSVLNLCADVTIKGADGKDKTFKWKFNRLNGHYEREGKEYPHSLNIRLDSEGAIEAKSVLGRFMNKYNVKDVSKFKGMTLPVVRENGTWKIKARV